MNKKALVFFTLLVLTFHAGQAQLNIDSIGQYYASTAGRITYQENVRRLQALDSTLTKQDFIALYYGAAFQPAYALDWIDSVEYKIKEYNLLQEFMSANELADSLLRVHPVSITAHFEKSFACYGLKRTSEEALAQQQYRIFTRCVLTSGTGLVEHPFYVVSDQDAIEVVKYLQVKYKTVSVEEDHTIVVALAKKYQGVERLYFKLVGR
jgi:hypothetical protein